MNNRAAAEAYRQATFENAPPIKLVRMLYEGALRYLESAKDEDSKDPSSLFVDLCGRADAIVTELRLALDPEPNPQVVEDLERLYLYVEERIGRASLERSVEPLAEATRVLKTLLEAWNRVEVESIRVA
ncbi:MAG: flagellar protein FliS [Planctomycetota bacterium]|jgi:flagellar protein FliS